MIVDIQGLSKQYDGVRALHNISFGIAKGGVVGLLGPNGAGKTTLVETIEGLRTPGAGRLSVLGLDPQRQARALKERLGAQLQATSLPPELTAIETLRMFAAFFEKSLPAREVLKRVGLDDQAKQRTGTLSGGQQRRLAIAIALINDPELVILDEPTSGLDPIARREIREIIAELRAANRTVILTTHDIEEAESLCDRVIFLRRGEIVADGNPFDLVVAARGETTLWIAVAGELDPAELAVAGAVFRGREGSYVRFTAADPSAVVVALGRWLQSPGRALVDLRMKRPNLESVYLELMNESDLSAGEAP